MRQRANARWGVRWPRCILRIRVRMRRSGTALRGVLCAVPAFTATRAHTTAKHGRARTPTQSKLAPAVTYVHCNKLRCTYIQRALHVTHVFAYATALFISLAPPPVVDPSSFPSTSYSIYFSLFLFRSHSYICTYVHTHMYTYANTYTAFLSFCSPLPPLSFSLCSSLCRSTSLSHSTVGVCT